MDIDFKTLLQMNSLITKLVHLNGSFIHQRCVKK